MKKIFLLIFSVFLFSLPGEVWKAPSAAPVPESIVYPSPLSASRWLWFQADTIKEHTHAYYRYTLDLPDGVKSAWAYVIMDDRGTMFVNGRQPRESYPPQAKHFQVKIPRMEFASLLKRGKNVLSFDVYNNILYGGLFLRGEITLNNGKKILLHSNKTFKAAPKVSGNWTSADYNDSGWKAAWEFGDALTYPWNTACNILEMGLSNKENALRKACMEKATRLPAGIANEKLKNVKLNFDRQAPGIVVDGKPIPPMLHVARDPFFTDAGDMIVKFALTGIRWVEVSCSDNDIIRDDTLDFSGLDARIKRVLHLVPDTFIGIRMSFSFKNRLWMAKNPEELIQYPTGKADQNNDTLRRKAPSMASEKYRKETHRLLEAFLRHVQKQPWSKRVISCRVDNGCFTEWHYYGMRRDMPDTGKAMTAAFRKYLAAKYKNDSALQKAWHTGGVTLKNATVPGVKERISKGKFLRDPASCERKVLDYYECHQHVIADMLLDLAGIVKKAFPNILVGAYYGYAIQMNFPSEGQTILLDKVLSSPNIDFLSAPICYDEARAPWSDGLKRSIPSIFARYKKLHIVEQDTRTHITYPKVYTPAHSAELFARDTASAWLDGCGTQLLSIHGVNQKHWMNSPEILTAIHNGIELWKKLYARPKNTVKKEVAVVFNPVEMYLHGYPTVEKQMHSITLLTTAVLHALYKSGHQFDLLDVKGFLAAAKQYKTVIFLNLFTVDKELKSQIAKALANRKTTVFWNYAPGLVTPAGWSAKNSSELTGINLKWIPGGKMELKKISVSPKVSLAPRMAADDPKAKKIAYYEDAANQCGMAKKKLADGSVSVFCGVPVTAFSVWHKLLKEAGSHAFTAPGVVMQGFGNRFIISTGKRENIPVTFPAQVKQVKELYSGRIYPVTQGKILLKSQGPEVFVLEY